MKDLLLHTAAGVLGFNLGLAALTLIDYRRHNAHLIARGEAGAELVVDPQALRTELVLDAANTWMHHYPVLPEAWLLLEAQDVDR